MKVAFIGTEIFPDLSHSKSNSRSGVKFFDARLRPKKVVRLPDQKSWFLANSLAIAGNTGGGEDCSSMLAGSCRKPPGCPLFSGPSRTRQSFYSRVDRRRRPLRRVPA